MRTLAVDLGFFTRFDLDIDARDTVLELDEIRDYPVVADTLFDSFSGEARHKAVGGAVKPELGEHAGDVYSLAAEVVFLACGAVCDPARQLVEPYDIVDRGVESYCVNQSMTSFITVSFLKESSGALSVMMQHCLSGEKDTGKTRLNFV